MGAALALGCVKNMARRRLVCLIRRQSNLVLLVHPTRTPALLFDNGRKTDK